MQKLEEKLKEHQAEPQKKQPEPEPAEPQKKQPEPEPAEPQKKQPEPEPAEPQKKQPEPEPAEPQKKQPEPEPADPQEKRPEPKPKPKTKQQQQIEAQIAKLPKRLTRKKKRKRSSAGDTLFRAIVGLIWRFIRPICLLALLGLVIWGIWHWVFSGDKERPEPVLITEATLESIIDVNELSTLEAVYTGIAAVHNQNVPSLVNYYVYYEAKVKAGIDADQIDMDVDHTTKTITVTLPKAKINDIIVDIASLDYIFVNVSYNKPSVTQEAYQKCLEDVTKESAEEPAICELAQENAKNMVEAMIDPFVQQLNGEYKLVIQ